MLEGPAVGGASLCAGAIDCVHVLGCRPIRTACTSPPPPRAQFVEDPYTKARFQPECEGQLSPVGDISKIGLDASGLVSSPTQLR